MNDSFLAYIQDTVDTQAWIEPMDVSEKLPMLAAELFSFHRLVLLGLEYALAKPLQKTTDTILLAKQVASYKKMLGIPVVLLFGRLTGMRRKRLIEERVPFFVENGQLFLPDVALHLMPTSRMEAQDSERFSSLAQLLYLYFLYHPSGARTVSEMGTWMKASDMSASRGLTELHDLGFLSYVAAGKTGKAKRYKRVEDASYCRRGWGYMATPVVKTVWIRSSDLPGEAGTLPKAGLDALSGMSMLDPPKHPVYAIWARRSANLKPYLLPSRDVSNNEQIASLQLWKYDPVPLSSGGCVDAASLALSLASDHDDRIQQAVHEMLEGMPWYMA